jgi:hypothetical protein
MDQSALVETQLTDAHALIRQLDAENKAPTFAAWYFYTDADAWKLLIAGPYFNQLIPAQEPLAYSKIAEALNRISPASISVSDIKIVHTDSQLAYTMKFLVRTRPNDILRMPFTDTFVQGQFVHNMILIRSAGPPYTREG